MDRISLADALASGDLEPFITQAEQEGVGPIDRAMFEGVLGRVIAPPPEGQTSHLPDGDCSPET
jgi:hypothetical protein